VIDCWFKELLRLRVLRLDYEVSQLPESMGNSKHLRYFGVCASNSDVLGFSTLTLPASISRLHQLKTIDCGDYVIERFPPGFSDLISLQKIKSWDFNYDRDQSDNLSLSWCRSRERNSDEEAELSFNQMEAVPHWNLQHLQVHGYRGESFPSWLRPHLLPRLRSLEFDSCTKIRSIPFFDNSAGADNHNIIEELAIRCCKQIYWKRLVEVPTSLRKLYLYRSGYFIDNLVSRFRDLTSLTDLQIDGCEWLTVIPLDVWSSNLPALEKLRISYCRELTSIGVSRANSSSNGVKGFSSLSEIHISSCYKLSSLEEFLIPDYLPVVKTICVECCELTSLYVDRLDGLQKLSILGCPRLNPWRIMRFPSTLKELLLSKCGIIRYIDIDNSQLGSSPALEKLTISSCPILRSIGGATTVTKIKKVEISDCPELMEIQQPLSR
jgi:hypothetical protein